MSYYHRDMLSINTRKILAQYLTQTILSVATLEPYREHLANLPQFNCVGLFRYLDNDQKGYLNYHDFKKIISDVDQHYLKYAFSQADRSKMGDISKIQFITFLLPKQNNQLKELICARISSTQYPQIPPSTLQQQIFLFTKILREIIQNEFKTLIPLRKKLIKSQDYSIKAIMNTLDIDRHGFIVSNNLYNFIKGEGFDIDLIHSDIIIDLYDSDYDGKLRIQQLHWAIEGLESKNSPKYTNLLQIKPLGKKSKKKQKQKKILKQYIENQQISQQYLPIFERYKLNLKQAQQIDYQLRKHEIIFQKQLELQKKQALLELQLKRNQIKQQQISRKIIATKIQQQATQRQKQFINRNYHLYQSNFKTKQKLSNKYQNKTPYRQINNNASRDNIQKHLQITDIYLQQSKQLRKKIIQERQRQKDMYHYIVSLDPRKKKYNYQFHQEQFSSPQRQKKDYTIPSTGKGMFVH